MDNNWNDDTELLALAESVGVMTIPNPKPISVFQRVLDAVGRAVIRERYIGRHRMPEPYRIRLWAVNLGRVVILGMSRVLAAVATLVPRTDVPAALAEIRAATDNRKRDISFFHFVIHQPQESKC
jgi:hypothetical protein